MDIAPSDAAVGDMVVGKRAHGVEPIADSMAKRTKQDSIPVIIDTDPGTVSTLASQIMAGIQIRKLRLAVTGVDDAMAIFFALAPYTAPQQVPVHEQSANQLSVAAFRQ